MEMTQTARYGYQNQISSLGAEVNVFDARGEAGR